MTFAASLTVRNFAIKEWGRNEPTILLPALVWEGDLVGFRIWCHGTVAETLRKDSDWGLMRSQSGFHRDTWT